MSEENKHPHSIVGGLFRIADQLEPLDGIKNPFVAAACGFLFGGIGLGLYLKSFKDFLIPFALLFAVAILGIPTGEALMLFVPFIWAAYGYYRVKTSNESLGGYSSAGQIIDAEVITSPPPIPASQKKFTDSL
jgi:hypothetical protein